VGADFDDEAGFNADVSEADESDEGEARFEINDAPAMRCTLDSRFSLAAALPPPWP
jgi:hypothetical protein